MIAPTGHKPTLKKVSASDGSIFSLITFSLNLTFEQLLISLLFNRNIRSDNIRLFSPNNPMVSSFSISHQSREKLRFFIKLGLYINPIEVFVEFSGLSFLLP